MEEFAMRKMISIQPGQSRVAPVLLTDTKIERQDAEIAKEVKE